MKAAKYLRKNCIVNLPFDGKTGKYRCFAFNKYPGHVQQELIKLNGIKLQQRFILNLNISAIIWKIFKSKPWHMD